MLPFFLSPRVESIDLPTTTKPKASTIAASSPAKPPDAPLSKCPPAGTWKINDPAQRRRMPDLTGFYEQLASPGEGRLLIQVCCAGQAIVGWYTSPPGKLNQPGLSSWPNDDPSLQPNRAGSFVVDTRSRTTFDDWGMWWDWGEPHVANTKDPHRLLLALEDPSLAASLKYGSFGIETTDPANFVIRMRFNASVRNPDRFKRFRANGRLPWEVISINTEPAVRDLLTVEHLQPFAPSWIEEVLELLVGKSACQLILDWHKSPSTPPSIRRLKRSSIIRRIDIPALHKDQLPEAHRNALLARIMAVLMTEDFSAEGEAHTFLDWYRIIAVEEYANSTNPTSGPFDQLGISPPRKETYAYIASYKKVPTEFAGKKGKPTRGIKGSVAGFSLSIRKVKVELILDANGARKYDSDGIPQVKNPDILKDEKQGIQFGGSINSALVGFFGDIGVGLGLSVDSGLSQADGKPGAEKKDLGGGVLGNVTFFSDYDLSIDDFDRAFFRIAAVKGPSAKVGNFVGIDIFSTTFHQYILRGGKLLEAIVTKKFEWSPPSFPKWDLLLGGIKGIKSYIEGWTKGKGSVTLFEVSMGFGLVLKLSGANQPNDTERPSSPSGNITAIAEGFVLFEYDKASFRTGQDIAKDGRYLLESWLATMRVLLLDTNGLIDIVGFTSPEGSRCYNEKLSEARAKNVSQAISDAFAGGMDKVTKGVSGLGEMPALRFGLVNPPEDESGLAAFKAKNQDVVQVQWPQWRKVEISASGMKLVIGFDGR